MNNEAGFSKQKPISTNVREIIFSFALIFACKGTIALPDQDDDTRLTLPPMAGGLMVLCVDDAEALTGHFGKTADKENSIKRYPLQGIITSRKVSSKLRISSTKLALVEGSSSTISYSEVCVNGRP